MARKVTLEVVVFRKALDRFGGQAKLVGTGLCSKGWIHKAQNGGTVMLDKALPVVRKLKLNPEQAIRDYVQTDEMEEPPVVETVPLAVASSSVMDKAARVLRRRTVRRLQDAEFSLKYDRDLFVPRQVPDYPSRMVEAHFQKFLGSSSTSGSTPNCFIILGPTGHGKTNLICSLAQASRSMDHVIPILLSGSQLPKEPANRVVMALLEQLIGPSAHPKPLDTLRLELTRLAKSGIEGHQVVVFVDAINEIARLGLADFQDLNEELCNIFDLLREHSLTDAVRICISCRSEYWHYFSAQAKDRTWLEHVWNPNGTNDPTVRLGPFQSGSEFQTAWERYCAVYRIEFTPEPGSRIRTLLSEPVMMRYFCEAYGDRRSPGHPRRLPDLSNITRLDIFNAMADRYREILKAQSDGMSDDDVVRLTTDLLLSLSELIHERRRIPRFGLDDVRDAARRIGHPDADLDDFVLANDEQQSIFARVVKSRLILDRDGQEFSFVFDSYFEYTLGRWIAIKEWLATPGEATHNLQARTAVGADTNPDSGQAAITAESFAAIYYALLLIDNHADSATQSTLFWQLLEHLLLGTSRYLWRQQGLSILRDSSFCLKSTWDAP